MAEEKKAGIKTAFLVIMPEDDGPVEIKTTGIGEGFKREATILDIQRACKEIESFCDAQGSARAVLNIMETISKASQGIVVPNKKVVLGS